MDPSSGFLIIKAERPPWAPLTRVNRGFRPLESAAACMNPAKTCEVLLKPMASSTIRPLALGLPSASSGWIFSARLNPASV
ncbi:MAG: hypothetical protein BWZ10_02987 [candidate division BRC1 bacterium ADurb.BinA364]|nr:MAG: hypothetical protein BWZ10_02987 [candidate division BRC1 bacterium ADurb.BinA364]